VDKETTVELQNYEKKVARIREAFKARLQADPSLKAKKLKLSWSNWGFGTETLDASARRLARHGIEWIELHGNRYGKDLGYKPKDTLKTLGDQGIKVGGICGMFSKECEPASNSAIVRQHCIDYIRRQLELCYEVGGTYLLVCPSAVGRPAKIDDSEFQRSVETLKIVADEFVKAGVKGAVEPIRSAEVSLCHTFAEAIGFIEAVDSPGVQHINGDVYHMQVEEANIADTIFASGERLINLHLADSNRCALGDGSMDLDSILMALYCVGYADGYRFATPEPLGPGGDPYPAMFNKPNETLLDKLVGDTARCFRAREEAIKA
jgi:sugar phosphate isomerase/epimerase